MSQKNRAAAIFAAILLAAAVTGCTSERSGSETAVEEVSSQTETDAAETEAPETEAVTEAVTEAATEEPATETLATETAAPQDEDDAAVSNITLTHITEGGEGLGVFYEFSGNIRGEVMQDGSAYRSWTLDNVSGHAQADDTVDSAAATFNYSESDGFSVNGTVEVLPADDPDYPNKMYFRSDDVDAFPKYMYDNRGDARRAKYIIENSSDVYMLLGKDNPPEEKSFAVSVTVDSVTVRYASDGSAYDTIHVTAASNR